MRILLTAATLACGLAACHQDKTPPIINMDFPLETATFSNGDTMWMHATFSDNDALKTTGMVVFRNDTIMMTHHDGSNEHGHNVPIQVSVNSQFRVRAEAEDVSGNMAHVDRTYDVTP